MSLAYTRVVDFLTGPLPSQMSRDFRTYEVSLEDASSYLENFTIVLNSQDPDKRSKLLLDTLRNTFTHAPAYEDSFYDYFNKHLPKFLSYIGISCAEHLHEITLAISSVVNGEKGSKIRLVDAFVIFVRNLQTKIIEGNYGVTSEDLLTSPDFKLMDRIIELIIRDIPEELEA